MKHPKLAQLLIGILLLANLAVVADRLVPPAHAVGRGLQYRIVPYDEANREAVLNKMAADGWELTAVEARFGGFIFEKE